MMDGVIGKLIMFWAFMLGVAVFGKVFGFFDSTSQAIFIFIGAALIFLIWTIGRAKAQQRREEREYEESMKMQSSRKGSKKKNKR